MLTIILVSSSLNQLSDYILNENTAKPTGVKKSRFPSEHKKNLIMVVT